MPNDDPLAYFITWPTYGTWLPDDERGWIEYRHGWQLPNRTVKQDSAVRMTEDACILTAAERAIVEKQIAETCQHKGWRLHAVQCRSNHLHVVVSAQAKTKVIRDQLKAWCSRRLNEHQAQIANQSTHEVVGRAGECPLGLERCEPGQRCGICG